MKNNCLIKNLLLLVLLSWIGLAVASASPMAMLQNTANNIINALQRNKSRLKNNPRLAYRIVNRYLIPKVDVYGMSRSVLGRTITPTATQLRQFKNAFIPLVVRTYAGALTQYSNEKVKFFPIRGGIGNQRFVQVNSMVVRTSGPPIHISYRLVRKGRGWKIYDMTVEGISLIQSYRSQFAQYRSFKQIMAALRAKSKRKQRVRRWR